MFKRIAAVIVLASLTIGAVSFGAEAKDDGAKERKTAIAIASRLYPGYIRDTFAGKIEDIDNYIKLSSPTIFVNAAVWKLNDGYIVYNPMNSLTFLIYDTGNNGVRMIGIPPSRLLALTGNPAMSPTDSVFEVSYSVVPKAIYNLNSLGGDLSASQMIAFLDRVPDSPTFENEALIFLKAPYARGATFDNCLGQIDRSKLTRRIKADLAGADLNDVIKAGFDYVDAVPISSKDIMLVQTSRNSGNFYAITAIDMSGKCTATETRYKVF